MLIPLKIAERKLYKLEETWFVNKFVNEPTKVKKSICVFAYILSIFTHVTHKIPMFPMGETSFSTSKGRCYNRCNERHRACIISSSRSLYMSYDCTSCANNNKYRAKNKWNYFICFSTSGDLNHTESKSQTCIYSN